MGPLNPRPDITATTARSIPNLAAASLRAGGPPQPGAHGGAGGPDHAVFTALRRAYSALIDHPPETDTIGPTTDASVENRLAGTSRRRAGDHRRIHRSRRDPVRSTNSWSSSQGGEERTVHRDEITTRFDVIEGDWSTCEVYLAGGRLNPGESLAVRPILPGWLWLGKRRSRRGPARPRDPASRHRPRHRPRAVRSIQKGGHQQRSRRGTSPCGSPPCTSWLAARTGS